MAFVYLGAQITFGMITIPSNGYSIYIGSEGFSMLSKMLNGPEFRKAKKVILVDENTLKYCFPTLVEHVGALRDAELIEIESGEESKNIAICTQIWQALTELDADRDAVFINLGGGVICDLGGFIASTFKRGIKFIHLPTTLLSQVDASVGGKTGIDLDGIKNQVGLFSFPESVFILPVFLNTLPKKELLSGFAEVIKHALIADASYWEKVKLANPANPSVWEVLIARSVEIKNSIVLKDPLEKDLRKVLNFGHTIGHAIESLSFENGRNSITHGEAVAIGMITESYLSVKYSNFPEKDLEEITTFIHSFFPFYPFDEIDFHRLIELMKNDKKNKDQQIQFCLISDIGTAVPSVAVKISDIKDALRYYLVTCKSS